MTTVLGTARRGHQGLYALALAMAVLAAAFLVLAMVDQRELVGAPLWFKPLKFALSFTVYLLALAWMLGQLPGRALARTGWVVVGLSVLEVGIIAGQAARGERSHFNDDGGLGSLLYSVMGLAAVTLLLLTAAVGVRLLRERPAQRDVAAAIRFGLALSLLGMVSGIVMSVHGGHAVGVADGGQGLPLVGWSSTGGELRISHFVGLHAIQLMPLLAAGLSRWATGLDLDARVRVVRVAGLAYGGLTALLLWQALRAQPLLAPDSLTLAAGALLLGATAAGLWTAARRAPAPIAAPARSAG